MKIEKLKDRGHSTFIKLNEMYNSINQAFSSYYKMRSILNRKDCMTTVVLKFVTCIDLGISQRWLLI